jgi:hypothetical protein
MPCSGGNLRSGSASRTTEKKSEGSFQVRLTEYRTIDVLPACFRDELLSCLMNDERIRRLEEENRPLGPGERAKLFEIVRYYLVPMKEYRFHQLKHPDRNQIRKEEPVSGITLLFADVPYDPKGIGFDFNAEPESRPLIG